MFAGGLQSASTPTVVDRQGQAPVMNDGPPVAHALTDPPLRTILAHHDSDARDAIALLLAGFSPDPRLDALGLLALLDGLGTQLLLGTCTEAEAAAIAFAHLDRLVATASRV